MKDAEVRAWSDEVLEQLGAAADFERYRRYVIPHLRNVEVPLLGLGLGRQLQFLTDAIRS